MMSADLLADAFDRIKSVVGRALDGLTDEELATRVEPGANTIGWLVWHLTRIQDDHICAAAGIEQAWTSQGWYDRFGLPFEPSEHGYGHSAEQVAEVRVSAELLRDYHDAVHARTKDYVATLSDVDYDRIVDTSFDPPVSLGVRLVSVISDDLQHAGQAGYVKGLLQRR
ncbi:MAG TPA: DinB family protein [Mycobacteriales bacterium]|nr:DinB family protein [Mycobacteriales bacterium]